MRSFWASLIGILIIFNTAGAQEHQPVSVHAEQSAFYKLFGERSPAFYDSLDVKHIAAPLSHEKLGNSKATNHNDSLISFEATMQGEVITNSKPTLQSDITVKSAMNQSFSNWNNGLLSKRVFGYHPYWTGTKWTAYRWDLLSDLCYFSYEVDPLTGNAITLHDFMTDPVIDTALARGVKVHLCVTLFSGHTNFFSNAVAQQRLIDNLISIMNQRGIHGINIDFEAVPSSQSQNLTTFIQQLSAQLHTVLPGSELSIATPAVNWNNTFDLLALEPWIDLFMIMTYDYYWGSSSLAGPVAGLWPLTSSFNYSTSKSITYYQSQGVDADKILMGVPYYGRDWPVESNTLPAQTTGSGSALTYRQIVGSGNNNYSYNNYYWDYRSYNPYFSYQSGTWRQCFFDNTRSLGHKYNIVNRRALAGIGIWALGYDYGHEELWDLIENKFTGLPAEACSDTLYDTGGPIWNYNNNEAYIETIETNHTGPLILEFNSLSFEAGYDSLWIYDGGSIAAPLILAVSGNDLPAYSFQGQSFQGQSIQGQSSQGQSSHMQSSHMQSSLEQSSLEQSSLRHSDQKKEISFVNKSTLVISTSSNIFTIRFKSDEQTSKSGYQFTWSCPVASLEENIEESSLAYIYPNPVSRGGLVSVMNLHSNPDSYMLTDISGRTVSKGKLTNGGNANGRNANGLNTLSYNASEVGYMQFPSDCSGFFILRIFGKEFSKEFRLIIM